MRVAPGFTTIEMIFVVILIGLITTLSVPKLRDSMRRRAVGAAGNEVVLAHSFARSAAVRYGRESRLRIDTATARFWVEVDTSGTGVRDTVGFIRTVADKGVQITSNRSVLCFDARGLAAINSTCWAGDALILLRSRNWVDTVRITPLGKVLR